MRGKAGLGWPQKTTCFDLLLLFGFGRAWREKGRSSDHPFESCVTSICQGLGKLGSFESALASVLRNPPCSWHSRSWFSSTSRNNVFAAAESVASPLGEGCLYDCAAVAVLQRLSAVGKPQGNMKQQKTTSGVCNESHLQNLTSKDF